MAELNEILSDNLAKIATAVNLQALEELRVELLGKNGLITQEMKKLANLSAEEKKTFGAEVNKVKNELTSAIDDKKEILNEEEINKKLVAEQIDITLPARDSYSGKIHPISQVIDEITAIFGSLGFMVAEGPEIETEFYNFDALNILASHPARDSHDTFYLNKENSERNILLRTHTSSVQIRTMQAGKPPFRIIAPGRTYRCDSDMTHSPMFHQVEGLVIDKDINMGHLKFCLGEFLKKFFELDEVPIRFRPSFFPFTEPSAEVDIGCKRSKDSLKIGAGSDWLEILGCGMVHPNVLRNVGIDPEIYQGFAFGMGIERITMLKYGIPDLRTFYTGDKRWIDNYGFSCFDIPSLVGGLSK